MLHLENINLNELEAIKENIEPNFQNSKCEKDITTVLQAILQNILQKKIQEKQDFFDLGMQSIELMKLIYQIKSYLGVQLSYSTIFECSSISLLTHYLLNSEERNNIKYVGNYIVKNYSK